MLIIPLPPRPLTGIAIFFIIGTGLGLAFPISQIILLPIATTGLILALLPKLPATPLTLATVLCLGWANASANITGSSPNIPAVIQLPAGGSLTGIVADEPVCTTTKNGKLSWKFPITAERVRTGRTNDWLDVTGKVRVRLSAESGERIPAYGERWIFSGYLNQAVFKQGLFTGKPGGLFFSGSAQKAKLLGHEQGNPLIKKCLQGRVWAGKLLAQGITNRPEQVCILNSILLGYYSQIPRDLYQAFANTGTLHVFAISGSHVVILGGAIIFMLAACGLPRTRWVLFLGPLLILYTAMTGLQPSAIRACIMGIIFWMAPLLGRKPDIFTTLAASAIIILAISPDDLINIGFILSYIAVLGLVLFCPVFSGLLKNVFAPDPLKLEPHTVERRSASGRPSTVGPPLVGEPHPKWEMFLRSLSRGFSELFSVSLAAWLVTMPLTLLFFGNFSPIGLPANLLVVPLSSLVIITGVLSLTLGSCSLFFADLFNHANLALIVLMTESARWFAAIPHGYMKAPPVPLWAALVFYGFLIITRFAIWVYAKEKPIPFSDGEE
jgi:ComEC/Rec2-related protein